MAPQPILPPRAVRRVASAPTADPETEADFSIFPELRAGGITDYLALTNRFDDHDSIGGMDCVYSSWATDAARGFDEATVAHLIQLMPFSRSP